jgi:CheY-specific phosphatase CheX
VQSEQIAEVLGSAAETVLETMFFTMAEGEAEPIFAPETELMRTAIAFSGEWSGTFEMMTPFSCARTIAEGFVGADEMEQMEADKVGEVMGELANMVCGSTLSQLANDKIFDLGAPRQLHSGEPNLSAAANAVTASRGLNLGEGMVAFSMAIETPVSASGEAPR